MIGVKNKVNFGIERKKEMRKGILRLPSLTLKESTQENVRKTGEQRNGGMKRSILAALFIALLYTPLTGCAEKTVGEQFREIIAEIDAQCKKDKLGPYLDQNDPNYLSKRARTDCDILTLKPADPLATEEGRFAYAIKLPAPHDKLKVQYQKGMNAETYFKALCEEDAGEWVFKTVEGVEGVFQGRQNIPESQAGDSLLMFQMREATEIISRNLENSLVQPIAGRYNYLERPADNGETSQRYMRFFRGVENKKQYPRGYTVNENGLFRNIPYVVNNEQSDTLKSRFGFTWRQVVEKDMLENGIVGGETIIYDRKTNDVLAFRRFFYRYWPRSDSRYIHIANHDFCRPRFADGGPEFIQKVLVPINPAE